MAIKIKQVSSQLDKEINLFEPGQKIAAIDIGSSMVKVVVLKETPIGTRLLNIGMAEVIKADSPGDKEPDAKKQISAAIRNALADAKINLKKTCIILEAPSLGVKNLTLPQMPEEELKESVKWELEQNINFPINEATIDFLISGETIRSGAKNLELEVAVAKTDEIKNFMDIFHKNQISAQAINISAFCLWNTFQKSNQWKENDTIALLDIGANLTRINIFSNNILKFTREIFLGGSTITQNLAKELNISEREAEEIKIQYGLTENSIHYDKIAATIKQLASEIDRSFGYYKAQFHIETINRVVIYGGSSKLINLDKFLSEALGLFAEIGTPLNGLLFDQKAFANLNEFASFFGTVIGAAMNSGNIKRANLLPVEFRKDTKLEIKKLLIKIIPVAVILLLAFIFANLIVTEKKLSKLKLEQEEIIAAWKDQQEVEKKNKFLSSLNSTLESWDNIFKGISSIIPEGVWLDSVEIDEPSKTVMINGSGESNSLAIAFVRKIETLKCLNSIRLDVIGEKPVDNRTYITFKITGKK